MEGLSRPGGGTPRESFINHAAAPARLPAEGAGPENAPGPDRFRGQWNARGRSTCRVLRGPLVAVPRRRFRGIACVVSRSLRVVCHGEHGKITNDLLPPPRTNLHSPFPL